SPQPLGTAVGALDRVRRHAVISPVPSTGKLRHGHELDRGRAYIPDRGQPLDHAVEGPGETEGADVQLVDDEVRHGDAAPGGVAPAVARRVHNAGGAVHTLRAPAAHRVRALALTVQAVRVRGLGR